MRGFLMPFEPDDYGVPMVVSFENVSTDRFTEATIERMYELLERGRMDIQIQDMAAKIVRGCPHKDYDCFGNKLLAAAKKLIPYVPDPRGIERVQDSWASLRSRRADCDDYAILIGAWGAGLGADVAFKTWKARRKNGGMAVKDEWSHVAPMLRFPNGQWKVADAVIKESHFGWEPEGFESKVWPKP